jgi:serine protease inhibitor
MWKVLRSSAIALVCFASVQCSNKPVDPPDNPPRELTAAEKHVVESDNKFGLKLFGEIVKQNKGSNVFISPLSVSMALGMTYNGAEDSTEKAMRNVLELAGLTEQEINESYQSLIDLLTQLDPKVIFEIANSIWCREGFSVKEEFTNINQTYFDAEVAALDFNKPDASKTINGWVDEKTHGKITEIVPDKINPETVMFLINAIYFKGTWTCEFDKEDTQEDWFNLPDSSQIRCQMMRQEKEFSYFENDLFQAVDLPYGNEKFSMTIFLPKLGVGTDSLISLFSQENWNSWLSSFASDSGKLYFPKFTLEYKIKLNDVLTALGMGIAFDQYQADFGGIADLTQILGNLYISEVLHKTYIKVDEEGTEAAAATSVGIGMTSLPPAGFVMRVDRPFVFAIRENHSQTILFMGKIVEPVSE